MPTDFSSSISSNTPIEQALKLIQRFPLQLQFASKAVKDNDDIVLQAAQSDPSSLQYASRRLRNHLPLLRKTIKPGMRIPDNVATDMFKEEYLELMDINNSIYYNLPESLMTDIDIAHKHLRFGGDILSIKHKFIKQRLGHIFDSNIYLFSFAALISGSSSPTYIHQRFMKLSHDTLLKAATLQPKIVSDMPQEFHTKDIFLASCSQLGVMLEFSKNNLHDDSEVVLAAIKQNSLAIKYASTRIQTMLSQLTDHAQKVAELDLQVRSSRTMDSIKSITNAIQTEKSSARKI